MKSKLLKSLLLLMALAINIQLQAQTQSPQKALSFDGVNDYVSGTTGISTSLTAFTIEAWVYHNTLSAVVQRYITINPEVVVLRYDGTIYGGTNALHFYLKKANGSLSGFLVENVLTTGTWMHIAGTYDGTTMKLYLNGNLIGSSSPAGGLYPPSGGYSFSSGGSEAFNGKMDEVSVWNYARAMSDIREDMYRTAPIANANLVNYWQFNNGSGATLTDLKGTATGTLNNMDNSNWVASTIPFAAGAVNTQIVNATGTKTFTGTGLVANFTAKSGTDTIVASRIDTLPNVSPTGVPTVFNSQYWAVKRFGSGTFTSNLTFTLSEDLTATDESLPANISLYARADNSDAGWTSLAIATSVNAANNTATFNGISGFSQFIVVRNCIPPAISSQSTASQTQPENCSFYPITVTATGTNITYQWYSNASASNSGGTSLGSGNGAQTYSYTPPGKAAGTLYYYCVVSGCGPSQTSAVSGAFISTAVAAPAGSGTLADPYRIASLDNLCWLQSPTNSSYWTSNFIQTADINAAPCKNWNGGAGFTPIGNEYTKFTGNYNGKGHIVDSIFIQRTSGFAGFFGWISNSTIDSLNLTNVSIIGLSFVAALAGIVQNSSIISHCSSSGSVTSSGSTMFKSVGGLVGKAEDGSPVIQYCYSSAEVNSYGASNGLNKGGLIGIMYDGTLTQCYARGLVSAGGGNVGGLVGASIHADQCYWDNQTSGQTSGGTQIGSGTWNLYGKSTLEMKTQSTFVGWDFTNNWYISANANNGYPCFYYALVLSTQAVSNVTNFTATANGTVERRGTFNITSYGVCYNTTGTPTTADNNINLGAAPYCGGAYTANLTGLHQGITYYVRTYAINELETVYGEQVSFTTTNVTQASTCLFNGDQYNYISIPNNSSLQLTNNYSIEVWLKPGVAVSTNRIIVSKGYNAGGYTLLSNGSGNQRGLIFDGMATADNILTQNQWCHVAAVNDNGTRHLYLNGVEMPLTGTPVSVTANTQPLYLSNYDNGGSSNCFRGYIEEVRLWNTAMTYSQIRENMHLPLTGSETGLVSYWQFDEGQPSTVYDKKGVNNGTWYASVINQYTTSTIPFGSGNSNTQAVSATGTTNFTNTGLNMNFTAKTGLDNIVVAKIDTFPNVNPTGLAAVFDRQYWAVHKYGSGTFTANLTFTIIEDLNAIDENNPSNIKLYTRSSMADDASWVLLASAASVNATTNQATFNGITGFSQFIIGKASPTASWTGNISTAWSGSSNWSDGVVPTASCDIIIPSGTTFSPSVNLTPASPAVCNDLTISAGAVLTIAAGKALTVNGALTNNAGTGGLIIESGGSMLHNSDNVNGTVKTYLTGEPFPADPDPCTMYHLVSVPLNPSHNSVSGLFAGGYLYGHVPADNSWLSLGTSTTNDLNEQNGFLVYFTANSTLSFAGPLNNGTFSPVVTYPGLPDNNNFALVPNPYPSKIDWNAADGWTKTNIGASIWIFNDGNYGVWDGTSGTHGATRYIAPGQAFFVQTTASSPALTMTNAVRTHETAIFFKNGNTVENQLRVLASGNETADELLIGFKPDCSDIYNPLEDALKIYGSSGVPQIYTSAGETPMTINNLAQPTGTKTVAMSFECEKAGEYSLSFSQIETFATGIQITLIDELTNQTINLSNQSVYTFIHNTENAANRFKLVFGGTIGINEPANLPGNLWIAGNTLYIAAPKLSGQTGLVEVYNISGQKLMSKTILLSELSTIELKCKGFVVARLTTGNEVLTVKGVLK